MEMAMNDFEFSVREIIIVNLLILVHAYQRCRVKRYPDIITELKHRVWNLIEALLSIFE